MGPRCWIKSDVLIHLSKVKFKRLWTAQVSFMNHMVLSCSSRGHCTHSALAAHCVSMCIWFQVVLYLKNNFFSITECNKLDRQDNNKYYQSNLFYVEYKIVLFWFLVYSLWAVDLKEPKNIQTLILLSSNDVISKTCAQFTHNTVCGKTTNKVWLLSRWEYK